MRVRAGVAAVIGVAVGLGCLPAVAYADPPVPERCVTILVSGPTAGGAGRFSAAAVEDLTISVLFRADVLHDRQLLALDLTTPKGFLYQTLTVPIAAPGSAPAERAIEGYPRPVLELAPRATTVGAVPYQRVDVPFPVGGTMIVTGSLYGTWHVAPRLNGASKPCAPATAFTIVQ